MKFIMFTKHLQEYDLPKLSGALKSIGLDGADLCVRPGFPVTPENCEKVLPQAVKILKDHGLTIPLVTGPGDLCDPSKKDAERIFAACGENGVGLIKLGYWHYLPGKDYWELVKTIRKTFEDFAALAAKHGVKAVTHTHSDAYMGLNASAAMQLVEGFNPKHIGIFLDPGHLAMCGEPPYMAIAMAQKYIGCFAFKDLRRRPEKIDKPPQAFMIESRTLGWGDVNWPTVGKAIIQAGFDNLPISLHSEYDDLPADSIVDMTRIDLRFIKKVFAEVRK